jgi:hypothetical protein
MHPQKPEPSDTDLLSAWLSEEEDGAGTGEAFLVVYSRYRVAVHDEMVQAGLERREAENRVGSVFLRAQDAPVPPDTPLRERLMAVAREVAADPHWKPES